MWNYLCLIEKKRVTEEMCIANKHVYAQWDILLAKRKYNNIVINNFVYLVLGLLSVQFNSVAQSCPTLCDPMNRSTPGLPVHHHLLEFTQTHVHWVGDAIQPSHPLPSLFPPAPNPSQHQSLFQWVNSSHAYCSTILKAKVGNNKIFLQKKYW